MRKKWFSIGFLSIMFSIILATSLGMAYELPPRDARGINLLSVQDAEEEGGTVILNKDSYRMEITKGVTAYQFKINTGGKSIGDFKNAVERVIFSVTPRKNEYQDGSQSDTFLVCIEENGDSTQLVEEDYNLSSRIGDNCVEWQVSPWEEGDARKKNEESAFDVTALFIQTISRPDFTTNSYLTVVLSHVAGNGEKIIYPKEYLDTDPSDGVRKDRIPRLSVIFKDEPVALYDNQFPLDVRDYSYAGYRNGTVDLPNNLDKLKKLLNNPVIVDVRDYGATPDDSTDDTTAFQDAIAYARAFLMNGDVIFYCPGKYFVSDVLNFDRSNFYLVGDGSNSSSITATKSLSEMPTETVEVQDHNEAYNFIGGIIRFGHNSVGGAVNIANITYGEDRKKGIIVDESLSSELIGKTFRIDWYDNPDHDLLLHMSRQNSFSDFVVGSSTETSPSEVFMSQYATIISINGNEVELNVPLSVGVGQLGQSWTAKLTEVPYNENGGIIGLTIGSTREYYTGHNKPPVGWNLVATHRVINFFMNDVTLKNGDSGFIANQSAFISVVNSKVVGEIQQHYGFMARCSSFVLFDGCRVEAPCVHTYSFNTATNNSLVTKCYASGFVTIDNHGGVCFHNAVINCFFEMSENIVLPGGGEDYMPHTLGDNLFYSVGIGAVPPSLAIASSSEPTMPGMQFYGVHSLSSDNLTIATLPASLGIYDLNKHYKNDLYRELLRRRGIGVKKNPPCLSPIFMLLLNK